MKNSIISTMTPKSPTTQNVITVGRMVFVHLHRGKYIDIPAKVDTGADTSAIEASIVRVNKNSELEYVLFRPESPYYDGVLHTTKIYSIKVVKSSTGHSQMRYTVRIPVYIESKRVIGTFTLADRSKNIFPILIGAKLLKNKFVVDVSCNYKEYKQYLSQFKNPNNTKSIILNNESRQDPIGFYNTKYTKKDVAI